MITWDTVLQSIPTIIPTTGVTGSAMLALFLWMIRNEKLWFAKQHDAIVEQKDKQIVLQDVAHGREMDIVKAELERTRADRDAYREAASQSDTRSDLIQDKVFGAVVPALSGVEHALQELTSQASTRGVTDP